MIANKQNLINLFSFLRAFVEKSTFFQEQRLILDRNEMDAERKHQVYILFKTLMEYLSKKDQFYIIHLSLPLRRISLFNDC